MRNSKTALLAALAHIEQLHPGWHAWASNERHYYAVSTRGLPGYNTSALTVHGDTPALLETAITAAEEARAVFPGAA